MINKANNIKYDLQEISMDLTAKQVVQMSKEMFPSTEKPLIVVKMFYVKIQD